MISTSKLGKVLLKCDISNEKYIVVNEVGNNVFVHLLNDNMELPSYLRVCRLTSSHFAMMVMNASTIDEHVKELRNGNDDVL